jgi:hypothetical protein
LFISECAFRQHLASVGGQRGDFGFTLAKRGGDVRQLCFRCGKDHGDRLNLRDGDNAGLCRCIDDVADIDLTNAGDPGDRCADAGVIELRLCVENRCLISGNLRLELFDICGLGVDRLLGGELAELGGACKIALRVGEVGFVLCFLGVGLIERGLEGPGINLRNWSPSLTNWPSLNAI